MPGRISDDVFKPIRHLMGTMKDIDVADLIGVSNTTLSDRRNEYGIPAYVNTCTLSRGVLILNTLKGMDAVEIGIEMNVSASYVRSYARRMKIKLNRGKKPKNDELINKPGRKFFSSDHTRREMRLTRSTTKLLSSWKVSPELKQEIARLRWAEQSHFS